MSKLTDKEIQDLLDKGHLHESDDADLYQKIYKILDKEPDYELSPQFAERVVETITSKSDLLERVLLFVAAFGVLSTLVLAIILINIYAGPLMAGYLPYIGIGSVLVIAIQWFDKYSRRLFMP